jgi:hypothetical protein
MPRFLNSEQNYEKRYKIKSLWRKPFNGTKFRLHVFAIENFVHFLGIYFWTELRQISRLT